MAAICHRRVRFVSAEPWANVAREKLASQLSPSRRSERSRTPSGSAVRMPRRRSAFVGPCVSSRNATSAALFRLGTVRSTRTTQPFFMNATSTVCGAVGGRRAV